eukprot:2698232-Rhodomonas_salina.1
MRAFVFANHATYGLLLLEANKKRKGGRHFQLPGSRCTQLLWDARYPHTLRAVSSAGLILRH